MSRASPVTEACIRIVREIVADVRSMAESSDLPSELRGRAHEIANRVEGAALLGGALRTRAAVVALEAPPESVTDAETEEMKFAYLTNCGEDFASEDGLRAAGLVLIAMRGAQRAPADQLAAEVERLNAIINTPQADDFLRAVSMEAEHQRQRWGSEHDTGKAPADWFWLLGYLGGKALHAQAAGNAEKAEHHIITTAAACANWHRAMLGRSDMRPGIDGAAALAGQAKVQQ